MEICVHGGKISLLFWDWNIQLLDEMLNKSFQILRAKKGGEISTYIK